MNEFELIQTYFYRHAQRDDLVVGNGDDCAVMAVPEGHQLATSIDTLVEGVHFLPDVNPEWLGHKCLAVSLSDLAAMGSVPRWATLALTVPDVDSAWLESFSKGFLALAERFNVALVGGDTTRGPLSISVQVMGTVRDGQAVQRSGAQVGDDIYVTGQLGDSCLGLRHLQGEITLEEPHGYLCQLRLERPDPRVGVGVGISPFATAMIDCSDGLMADLGHLLSASEVGADIACERIPLSEAVSLYVQTSGDWKPVIAGGDDYELVFTANSESRSMVAAIAESVGCPITWLGAITESKGMRLSDDAGNLMDVSSSGYRHF